MKHTLKVLSIKPLNHNVHCIRLEKPAGYHFTPGQATDVIVNKEGWTEEVRPFTFTCLNEEPYLEFSIKSYNDHEGVTKQIGMLHAGDELIIDDPWGTIEYQGEGYFIAGGAGLTPFMAIFRQLHKEGKARGNKLFFSNKTKEDVFYEAELKSILGENALFIVTDKKDDNYLYGYIDEAFLKDHVNDFKKHFYICGPDNMIKAITDIVIARGANAHSVVFEK